MLDETKKVLSIKPLLKPSTCKYQVGLSTTGMPICCPRKATIIVNKDGGAEAGFAAAFLMACLPVAGIFISLYNFITIYAAPKVYLLNYFVDLYRRTK